jgi:Ca2+-binding EF-hand superfamily protein
MDDDRSRSLDMYEFSKAMNDYKLGFQQDEIKALFRAFDSNGDGTVDYDEFLRVLRGPMNEGRKKLVAQAFSKLDKDQSGSIDVTDLKGVYDASHHPDVKSGKRTEEDILNEFLETFEMHHNTMTRTTADHIITKEEFEEYYNNISSSIDNDEYF